MIRITDLAVRYRDVQALSAVSCQAAAGRVVAVVGPNGAGKSTLLHAIAGTLPAASLSGNVTGAECVAFCPDSAIGFFDLSIAENLDLLMLALDWDSGMRSERVPALVELVCGDDRPPGSLGGLSLGMRRRVDLVLTVCKPASVYLFDEPYNGLDARWVRTFSRLLGDLAAAGRTCVVASHAVDLLLPVADTVWEFDAGHLTRVHEGATGEFTAIAFDTLSAPAVARPAIPWLTCGR